MKKNVNRYEYLTQTPVPQLVCRLAVPTILSMLVTGLYNSADTFFVGRISTQATAAVGLVFSVMAMIQALGFFCGQGSGSFLSRLLGAGKKQEAAEAAATGFTLALIIGVIVAVLGNLLAAPLGYALGAGPSTIHDTLIYMRIILIGAPFMIAQFVINNQLRYQGSAAYAMIGLLAGAIINIGLDPLLMFGFIVYETVADEQQWKFQNKKCGLDAAAESDGRHDGRRCRNRRHVGCDQGPDAALFRHDRIRSGLPAGLRIQLWGRALCAGKRRILFLREIRHDLPDRHVSPVPGIRPADCRLFP